MKTKRKAFVLWPVLLATVILLAALGLQNVGPAAGHAEIAAFAKENRIPLSQWPGEIVELLEKNPETKEFVLHYPLRSRFQEIGSMEQYENCDEVPLLMQWDLRWGYHEYGGKVMGLSGCGPTCLSMVCLYLLGDGGYDPAYIADFGQREGYYVPGIGSSWTLISEGGPKLGLDVDELPLDENLILRELKAGNPVICAMGPGDFTTSGHFIVIVGTQDGKLRIHDPNSIARSRQLWDYDQISGQIRNLWTCKVP